MLQKGEFAPVGIIQHIIKVLYLLPLGSDLIRRVKLA